MIDVAAIILDNTICYILFMLSAIITAPAKLDPLSYCYRYELMEVNACNIF